MQNLQPVEKLIEERLASLDGAVENFILNEIYTYMDDFIFDDDLVLGVKEFILYNGMVEFEQICIDISERFDNVPTSLEDYEAIVKAAIGHEESEEDDDDDDSDEYYIDELPAEMVANLNKLVLVTSDAAITDEIFMKALLYRLFKREIVDRDESIITTKLMHKMSDYLKDGNPETLLRLFNEKITDSVMNELLDDASDVIEEVLEEVLKNGKLN